MIPDPTSTSETSKSSHPPQAPSTKQIYNATYRLRHKLRSEYQELEDPKKRAEVESVFDIWKKKHLDGFNAFQERVKGKEIAWRDLHLQEWEIQRLWLGYKSDLLKNFYEKPQVLIAKKREEA
ncbi:hypothetical protein H0H93_003127, partial [Arthromyces matolae]